MLNQATRMILALCCTLGLAANMAVAGDPDHDDDDGGSGACAGLASERSGEEAITRISSLAYGVFDRLSRASDLGG